MSGIEKALLPERASFALRHPRWTAGVAFSVAGATASFVICVPLCFLWQQYGPFAVLLTITAALAAFCSGARTGSSILIEQNMTNQKAYKVAMRVVFQAHAQVCGMLAVPVLISATRDGGLLSALVCLGYVLVGFALSMLCGIVTFPVGALCGLFLKKYGRRIGPTGCSIHGYRLLTDNSPP